MKIKFKLKFFEQQRILDALLSKKILEEESTHFTKLSSPLLYRGDTRGPEIIFKEGFNRRIEDSKECIPSITANMESRNCISTSKDIISALGFADCPMGTQILCAKTIDKPMEFSWVYMIYSEEGIDLTLMEPQDGNNNRALMVNEVALLNVLPENVMAAFQIKTTKNTRASYWGPYNKFMHQDTSSWQILVTKLELNDNCRIKNESPSLYEESILPFREIHQKGYIRIPWSPLPEDPEFILTHSLNPYQKIAFKLGLTIEEAKQLSSEYQAEGLKCGFTLEEVLSLWFSDNHVSAANKGISIEHLRFQNSSQAYGLERGLSPEELLGLSDIKHVKALLLGFNREDITSNWFSSKHFDAGSNKISINFLRGLTWSSYDI